MTTNVQIVRLDDGREVCLSYGVPVAAFIPGRGFIRTARKYSATSSRHATSYTGDSATVFLDEEFCRLVAPIATRR